MDINGPQVLGQQPVQIRPPHPPQAMDGTFSNEDAHVLFHNTAPRHVLVFRINYYGRRNLYAVLRPNAAIEANTSICHAWLFRDNRTGEFMQVQKKKVYWPQIYKRPHPINAGEWIVDRRKIDIHLPVDSLTNRCLWSLAEHIKTVGEDKYVLTELPLPQTLIKALTQILLHISVFHKCGGFPQFLTDSL